jgi:uncharacterized protein YndB with AHSA1/START domain
MKNTDRIEKEIVLRAPRSRVWRAIADSREFGAWFQMKVEGAFTPGATVHGRILVAPYDHLTIEMFIERVEPEQLFSYRWHPNTVEPAIDYSKEPTTLVEIQLDEVPGGTRLRLVESGFDQLPADRRGQAFRANDAGWTEMMPRIEKHVVAG